MTTQNTTSAAGSPVKNGGELSLSATTLERYREILARSRAISVPEDDTDDVLAKANQNLLDAERAVADVERAGAQAKHAIADVTALRQRILGDMIANVRRASAAARAKADEPPDLAVLQESEKHLERAVKAGARLLSDPLSAVTRQMQARLMVTSFVALLVTQGLFVFDKVQDLKPAHPWSLVLAGALLCVYFGVAFVTGYMRDVRVLEVARVGPAVQLQVLTKQAAHRHAEQLEAYVRELEALRATEDVNELILMTEHIHDMVSGSEAIDRRIKVIHGVVGRMRMTDRLRRGVELLLPLAIGALAIIASIQYLWHALRTAPQ